METGKVINKISNRLRRRSKKIQESIGISGAKGNILNYILVESENHPVYQKEIEEEFGLRPSTATETLKNLEQAELICRVPESEDGRYKKIVFTEQARKIEHILRKEITESEELLLQGITEEERKEFFKIIYKIFRHKEFQRRMTSEFNHHNDITLGYHVLEVALCTYKTCKKKIEKGIKVNIDVAVKIAMLHDFYELPWQNNKESSSKNLIHKHGFRHPIEAVINAIYYYPFLFKNELESIMIIDGIVHHMYPLAVPVLTGFDTNEIELKNYDKVKKIDKNLLDKIIYSTNRGRIIKLSLCKSKFIEGRIVSNSDTFVSINNYESLKGVPALITGVNKNIEV